MLAEAKMRRDVRMPRDIRILGRVCRDSEVRIALCSRIRDLFSVHVSNWR